MKKFSILVASILIGSSAFNTLQAQQQAKVTLDKGLTVTSSNDKFSFTLEPRLMNLVETDWDNSGENTGTDFIVNKVRLAMSGHVFSKKLTYSIQLGFGKGDTKSVLDNQTNIVRNAILYYQPSKSWKWGLGQAKIKVNRAHMTSSQKLEFTSRSIVDGAFEQDRDFGAFVEYNHQLAGTMDWAFLGSVTSGEGRNFGKSTDSGLNYAGRIELYPLGKFNAYSEGDLSGDNAAHLMIGGAVSYNDRAMRTDGQNGKLWADNNRPSMTNYYIDMVLKCAGLSVAADVMGRTSKSPTTDVQYMYKGWGYNVQASYTWQGKWAVALRNSTLLPAEEIRSFVKHKSSNQTTLAVTRYIVDHRVKIGTDVSYTNRSEATGSYNRWAWRTVLEVGF